MLKLLLQEMFRLRFPDADEWNCAPMVACLDLVLLMLLLALTLTSVVDSCNIFRRDPPKTRFSAPPPTLKLLCYSSKTYPRGVIFSAICFDAGPSFHAALFSTLSSSFPHRKIQHTPTTTRPTMYHANRLLSCIKRASPC